MRLLMCAAPKLLKGGLTGDLELLMTHGGEDRICPPKWSQAYFQSLPLENKRYCHFADLLHEPFNDIGRENVLLELERWLDEVFAGEASRPETALPTV